MRVLIAFESSGTVREAFSALGHETWSVDLLEGDTYSPNHIVGDAFDVISGRRRILGRGWNRDRGYQWDLVIAHPPCTSLCVAGNRYHANTPMRAAAVEYVKTLAGLLEAWSHNWVIENPVGVLSTQWKKPTQYIQPFEHGHYESKKTGLWLSEGLAPLRTSRIMPKPERGYWLNQTPSGQNNLPPSEDRWKLRSKTYSGIALAMAEQWGGERSK
jgi:site-specific DNA-cytosine methylase